MRWVLLGLLLAGCSGRTLTSLTIGRCYQNYGDYFKVLVKIGDGGLDAYFVNYTTPYDYTTQVGAIANIVYSRTARIPCPEDFHAAKKAAEASQ